MAITRNKITKKEKFDKMFNNIPEHIKNLVLLVRNNAEIRRYTSLGMINKIKQKGLAPADAKIRISFLPTKISINIDGLRQEHYYNNTLFINCLAAAFPSFAHNANKIINNFINEEQVIIDNKEIENTCEEFINTISPVEEDVAESSEMTE